MLKIDSLTLHLPPEFAGRERALGEALAHALSTVPYAEDRFVSQLSHTVQDVSPTLSNTAIASRIAQGVGSRLAAPQPDRHPAPAHPRRASWRT